MSTLPREHRTRGAWPVLLGLAGAFWVIAAISFAVGRMMDARFGEARSWPTTDGVVVRSAVYPAERYDWNARRTIPYERLDFAYTYEVAGHSYEGSNYDASGAGEGSYPRVFGAKYPVGTPVQVHYDPDDPASSGLSVEGPSTVGFRIMTIGFGVVGLVLAAFAVRSWLRRSMAC